MLGRGKELPPRAATGGKASGPPRALTGKENRIVHRSLLLLFGWTCVALGVAGVFLPLMPTTVFLIMAAWAFARSSDRWHSWLHSHERFGPLLACWERHRAMPRQAKVAALLTLAASYAFTAWMLGPFSTAALIGGACIAGVAIFLAHIPVMTQEQFAQLVAERDNR
jgi:uncharacterized membrane protein YbaN (DUF454 family)